MVVHSLAQSAASSSSHCLPDSKETQQVHLIMISLEALWWAFREVNINLCGIKCLIQEDEKQAPPHPQPKVA